MKVDFLFPARFEFEKAIDEYDSKREGLGFEFADEVQRAIQRVLEYPDAWPRISRRCRRCRTHRFPYGVIYQIQGDTLLIVGVTHLHRAPESWRSRVEP